MTRKVETWLMAGTREDAISCTATALYVEPITAEEYGESLCACVLTAFGGGTPRYGRLVQGATGLSRSFGGNARSEGLWLMNRWFGPEEDPRKILALPVSNTAENCERFSLEVGARIAFGPIAGGCGDQLRVCCLDRDKIRPGPAKR